MKKQSKLGALPSEDQKRILELCDRHTYDEVVVLVAKPRDQDGLDLKTNRSALSRFNRDHGTITANCQLASQFLELLDHQPLDFEDLVSPLAHLVGQSALVLAAQNRPYEEYRRLIDTFLRLERVGRERDKLWHAREAQRRSMAQCTNAPHTPGRPQPTQTTTPPPNTVKLDFTLPSFKATPSKPNNVKPTQADALKLPDLSNIFSDLSLKTPGNLTNLTKSHITTAPSRAVPCP